MSHDGIELAPRLKSRGIKLPPFLEASYLWRTDALEHLGLNYPEAVRLLVEVLGWPESAETVEFQNFHKLGHSSKELFYSPVPFRRLPRRTLKCLGVYEFKVRIAMCAPGPRVQAEFAWKFRELRRLLSVPTPRKGKRKWQLFQRDLLVSCLHPIRGWGALEISVQLEHMRLPPLIGDDGRKEHDVKAVVRKIAHEMRARVQKIARQR